MNIGVGMVKNGCGHSGLMTLKLGVFHQERINGVNWFLVVDKISGNLKATLIIFELCWSEMGVAF